MNIIASSLDGAGLKIGIVHSRFNAPIVEKMLAACVAELLRLGVADSNIDCAGVPGALEIPLVLEAMAMTDEYDALIAIGAVIRGETYHFEVVSNESCRGVTNVALQTGIPIANGILTTNTEEQALARVEEKGVDCAQVAIEMANLLEMIVVAKDEA